MVGYAFRFQVQGVVDVDGETGFHEADGEFFCRPTGGYALLHPVLPCLFADQRTVVGDDSDGGKRSGGADQAFTLSPDGGGDIGDGVGGLVAGAVDIDEPPARCFLAEAFVTILPKDRCLRALAEGEQEVRADLGGGFAGVAVLVVDRAASVFAEPHGLAVRHGAGDGVVHG